jgi:hypothetical protein
MNRIFYVIGVVVVAVRHAVLHFEVRRGEFVPLINGQRLAEVPSELRTIPSHPYRR